MTNLKSDFYKSRPQFTHHDVVFHVANLESLMLFTKPANQINHENAHALAEQYNVLADIVIDMLPYCGENNPDVVYSFNNIRGALEDIADSLIDAWRENTAFVKVNHATLETLIQNKTVLKQTQDQLHALRETIESFEKCPRDLGLESDHIQTLWELQNAQAGIKHFRQRLSTLEDYLGTRTFIGIEHGHSANNELTPIN